MPRPLHLLRGAAIGVAIWLLAGCFTNKKNEGARLYQEHCSSCPTSYPCLAARERDAYRLQADWLRQQGVSDPHASMGVDAFTIAVISMCRDE